MYQIITENKIFYTADKPNYVKKKTSTGAWISATKDNAEAVAINGKIFNLDKTFVKEIDGGIVILETSNKVNEHTAKVVDLQEAICDLSIALEELKNGEHMG